MSRQFHRDKSWRPCPFQIANRCTPEVMGNPFRQPCPFARLFPATIEHLRMNRLDRAVIVPMKHARVQKLMSCLGIRLPYSNAYTKGNGVSCKAGLFNLWLTTRRAFDHIALVSDYAECVQCSRAMHQIEFCSEH